MLFITPRWSDPSHFVIQGIVCRQPVKKICASPLSCFIWEVWTSEERKCLHWLRRLFFFFKVRSVAKLEPEWKLKLLYLDIPATSLHSCCFSVAPAFLYPPFRRSLLSTSSAACCPPSTWAKRSRSERGDHKIHAFSVCLHHGGTLFPLLSLIKVMQLHCTHAEIELQLALAGRGMRAHNCDLMQWARIL